MSRAQNKALRNCPTPSVGHFDYFWKFDIIGLMAGPRKKAKKTSKKTQAQEKKEKTRWHDNLKTETKHSIFAIFAFVFALIFTLAAFGRAGLIGRSLYQSFHLFFGAGFFLLPVAFFLVGLSFLFAWRKPLFLTNFIGAILFLLATLGLISLVFKEKTGGYIGFLMEKVLIKLFDFWAGIIILVSLLVASVLIIFNIHLPLGFLKKEKKAKKEKQPQLLEPEESSLPAETYQEPEEKEVPIRQEAGEGPGKTEQEEGLKLRALAGLTSARKKILPPFKLLEGDRGKSLAGDIKANANIIKRILQTFGIDVEMDEINIGPSVTQYTLKPAEGIKLARITALHSNLALALASHPIRIEAPIPGRSLVGIEVPNRSVSLVGLKFLIDSEVYKKSSSSLLLALGRDVSNQAVFANLAKMPHLLIAGSTGAGKSICIHSLMMSLIYRNTPEELRFLMIDPKRVELSVYNKLPHILTPVITDAKKTISALRWSIKEMETRYELLSGVNARDIDSYHQESLKRVKKNQGPLEPMPYLVIVIDELADIMAVYPKELEAVIVRLAQMARAVGIHLVISTQRPSVEVITGLIKANITSRIAFQVASQIDSRTILDRAGADRLLGNGDMLYLAGDSGKPKRIQGAFVSEQEVKGIVNFLASQYDGFDFDNVNALSRPEERAESSYDLQDMILNNEKDELEDNLYEEARELAVRTGKISASYLQRRLRVGYARAARLLDLLEAKGVIGPAEGAKPREVYIRPEEK